MPFNDPEWRTVAQDAAESVSLIDHEDRLLYVNHPQPGADDYEGRSVFDYIPAEYRDVARRCIDRARGASLPQHYASKATGPDGGTSHYSNWIVRLSLEGDPVVAMIATDITARRRIEDALGRADRTFRSLVDNAPDHIMIVDRDRRILFVNRFQTGHPPERVYGQRVETFVTEEDRDRVRQAVDSVIETGGQASYETVVRDAESEYHFATRVSPILVDGRVERVTMISANVTEARLAEREQEHLAAQLQQSQKMNALGQLTGGVAHDFNNILTAISGNLELAQLEMAPDDPSAVHLVESLHAVDRAVDLIRRLMVFSRKQRLRPQSENINGLVEGMLTILQRTLGESIQVETVLVEGVWPCEVDRGQLEQAILNLAVNARDAMPRGGVLRIETENVALDGSASGRSGAPSGEWVALTVRDTGVGMADAILSKAFEPFFTTKEVGKGTGLGLSMVYGFAAQSGGHVRMQSAEGEGTEVQILLPRAEAKPNPEHERVAPSGEVAGGGEVVLVVEDEDQVRTVSVSLLERLGYRTLEAGDGPEALALLEAHSEVDVLFTDIGLPGELDGVELSHRARTVRPALPVLFTSGYSDAATSIPAGERPAELLPKPFSQVDLATALHRTLSKSAE